MLPRTFAFASTLLLCAGARAEDDPDRPPVTAARAASAGAFSPFTMSARSDTQRALVHVSGGYDAARGGAIFESVVEATLVDRFALRLGGSYAGPDGQLRPLVSGRLDALRQRAGHGVDLAFSAGYEPQGFNTVPAVVVMAAVGRTIGDVSLVANVGAGAGLEEAERYGDARLAATVRVAPSVRVGLDSRVRIDLERDDDEPDGEPDWQLVTGPMAAFTVGRFAVTGGAGVSAIRLRQDDRTDAGAVVHVGLGAVF